MSHETFIPHSLLLSVFLFRHRDDRALFSSVCSAIGPLFCDLSPTLPSPPFMASSLYFVVVLLFHWPSSHPSAPSSSLCSVIIHIICHCPYALLLSLLSAIVPMFCHHSYALPKSLCSVIVSIICHRRPYVLPSHSPLCYCPSALFRPPGPSLFLCSSIVSLHCYRHKTIVVALLFHLLPVL